jgi:hypothetical protein
MTELRDAELPRSAAGEVVEHELREEPAAATTRPTQ